MHEAGPDDPRNGLVFCATHHRAFDAALFAIEPGTLTIVCRTRGPDAARLGITRRTLGHLDARPHEDALRWAWARWRASGGNPPTADETTSLPSGDTDNDADP